MHAAIDAEFAFGVYEILFSLKFCSIDHHIKAHLRASPGETSIG
jgi:hypothetical protein